MNVSERCILKHILLCTDGTSSQAPLGLRQQLCQHLLSRMHTSQSIVHHVLYVVFITEDNIQQCSTCCFYSAVPVCFGQCLLWVTCRFKIDNTDHA